MTLKIQTRQADGVTILSCHGRVVFGEEVTELREHLKRYVSFLGGVFLILSWVALVRFGLGVMWISPLIPWALITCTIISCSVFQP
jgi:hypothetical protein